MNKEYTQHIINLFEKLRDESILYMDKNLPDEILINDVFNLIISSHINSLCSLVDMVTTEDKEANETSRIFCRKLHEFIMDMSTPPSVNLQ